MILTDDIKHASSVVFTIVHDHVNINANHQTLQKQAINHDSILFSHHPKKQN